MKEIFVYTGGNQVVPKDVERVRIDPSVKIITKKAFERCTKLQYVEFCEGVQEIGEAAFYRCISLESVRLAPTIRVIHKIAFQDCTSLRYLILNEGLETIGVEAFDSCESIEFLKLPSTMRQIEARAFRYCRGLKEAFFNKDLAGLGPNAFQYCTNWRSVVNCSYSHMKNKKDKFRQGSLKWIPREKSEDKTFWSLVSSNADNADKVIKANCGMLLPSDGAYATHMSTTQNHQVQNDVCWNDGKVKPKHQLALALRAIEVWKEKYYSLQALYNSLAGTDGGPMKNSLKRAMPMQESTNQQSTQDKKLRPFG